MLIDLMLEKVKEENRLFLDDELEYHFELYGVKGLVKRQSEYGHLCGYVYVDDLSDIRYQIISENVHGGITWDRDNLIGFDCAHAMDTSPRYYLDIDRTTNAPLEFDTFLEYRNFEYVQSEVIKMIWIIKGIGEYKNIGIWEADYET